MNLRASPSHSTRTVAFPDLPRVFALVAALLMLLAAAASAQQPVPRKSAVSHSSKPQPQFQEVEDLVRQGSLDQAKQRIQDVLRQNPSSVEANNLLGIICTEQKDFPGALDAFLHALKLDPSSTRTRNNLGNVYAAEGKSDLAEKEFRAVVRLDPANRDGNYNLGLILMAKNQPV
jgi:Tfp pilus assembly protein PilF